MVDRRSQALQDQFKKSVRKARVAGIDTRRGPKTDIKQSFVLLSYCFCYTLLQTRYQYT